MAIDAVNILSQNRGRYVYYQRLKDNGYTTLYTKLNGYVFSKVIKLVAPMPFSLYVSLIILLIGMFVGMIGSARAVRRYIKV